MTYPALVWYNASIKVKGMVMSNAIENTRRELHEAFGIVGNPKHDRLVEVWAIIENADTADPDELTLAINECTHGNHGPFLRGVVSRMLENGEFPEDPAAREIHEYFYGNNADDLPF